jgi:diguanylate cyclase (GGDEF)-like protein
MKTLDQKARHSMLFSLLTLPLLLLFIGLHAYALHTPSVLVLYRAQRLSMVQWGLVALALWSAGMLVHGARHACDHARSGMLRTLAFTPILIGFVGLAIGYGLKDTPMGILILVILIMGRGLFDLRTLIPGLVLGMLMMVGTDLLMAMDAMPYAPLLVQPLHDGRPLTGWWVFWTRAVFDATALPFSAMLFYFFGTLTRRRQRLESIVRTDVLTGIANRRAFMARLESECTQHAHSGRPLCVLLCDVDHFKKVNDTFGHPAGDAVLAHIGLILRETTRNDIDLPARIGGEEFAVLLPDTRWQDALHMANNIAEHLRQHVFVFNGQRFQVTQSIGVAQARGDDGDALLREADVNLYRAKHEGRDRVVASVEVTK